MPVRFQYSRFDADQLLRKDSDSIYRSELLRIESFKNWPNLWIQPEKLTAAGFYYIGEKDKVECFECEIGLSQWNENNDPIDEHKRWSPTCRFIRGFPCGNVPIGIGPTILIMPKREDMCEPRYSSEKSRSSSNPKHPKFATYHVRLASFATWLKVFKHFKEKLAAAGLFYTGQNDQTVCYQCGIELNDWAANDDPMDKHKRLSSTCRFIRDGPCDNFPIGIGPAIPIVPKREDVCESCNLPKKSSSFSSPKHPKYATYDTRLASFATWLKHLKEKLAAAGLFYTGLSDETVCYQCGVELNDWVANDDPMDKHKRLSPTCKFIRDGLCDNFPIRIDPAIPIVPKREDVCESCNLPKKSSSFSSPKHPKYATYDARLASFALWLKVLKHLKEKLVAAGLFYTGQSDETVCYQCGVELNDWAANDDPMDKHKRLSPTCSFIRDSLCDNFPIGIDPAIPIVPKREDVCESWNLPKKSRSSSSPKHPKYATYDARLASFALWLKVLKHLKEKLVAAGLFYTGQSDETVCYQCGVELNDWAANDDPMDKHKRLSPTCSFIRDSLCDNFPIGIDPAIPIVPKREDVCESWNLPKKSRSSSSPKHPKYATYDARLASFALWLKVLKHLKEKLVAAGLFYTGQSDETVCYQCGVELNDWAPNDDPMDKHKRLSPTCRFIRDSLCDNFPIGIDPAIPIVPKREDVCESWNLPKKSRSSSSPKHPKYATYDARLASFALWLKVLKHLKEKLVAAGLFYTGQSDETVCYQCGVELNDWAPNDDPMDKHKRLSPTCRFIRDSLCDNFPIGIGPAIPIVPKREDVCESRNSPKKSSSSSSPKHPKYATYDARLASFALWLKVLKHLKEKLAAAGLFYTGQSDETVCYQCGVELNDWAANDDPMDKHKRLSPTCRFIRDDPCDNFSIGIGPAIPIVPKREDVCESRNSPKKSSSSSSSKHPKYATYDARLASFAMWSRVLSHLNETLAAAGLFYTGQSDRTECHQCGIELKDWAADDDPWQKHAQSSGDCPYLLRQMRESKVKEYAYVAEIIKRRVGFPGKPWNTK